MWHVVAQFQLNAAVASIVVVPVSLAVVAVFLLRKQPGRRRPDSISERSRAIAGAVSNWYRWRAGRLRRAVGLLALVLTLISSIAVLGILLDGVRMSTVAEGFTLPNVEGEIDEVELGDMTITVGGSVYSFADSYWRYLSKYPKNLLSTVHSGQVVRAWTRQDIIVRVELWRDE